MQEDEHERNKFRSPEKIATTLDHLPTDCLTSVLAFGEPREVWKQRLTNWRWRTAVLSALAQTRACSISYAFSLQALVDLCPNIAHVAHLEPELKSRFNSKVSENLFSRVKDHS